jgi:hypothetical protein
MVNSGKPLTRLAQRYRMSDGQTATREGVAGNSGYTVLPVSARRLFMNEVL